MCTGTLVHHEHTLRLSRSGNEWPGQGQGGGCGEEEEEEDVERRGGGGCGRRRTLVRYEQTARDSERGPTLGHSAITSSFTACTVVVIGITSGPVVVRE